MRKLLLWAGLLALGVIAMVVVVRLMWGLDILTGDDPDTVAATKQNPNLEIDKLPYSGKTYRVKDLRTGARAYFELTQPFSGVFEGVRLTGPMRIIACDPEKRNGVPEWVPIFPKARNLFYLIAGTEAGDRRFVSFNIDPTQMREASDFYKKALNESAGFESLSYVGNAPRGRTDPATGLTFREDGADFYESATWANDAAARRIAVTLYYYRYASAPLVEINFREGT